MPDTEGPEKRNPGNREFMREKIEIGRASKRQIAKRVLILMCLAVLFGVISAVSFVLAKPLADRYLGREETEESTSIVFAKDDPETAAVGPTQEETLPIHVEEEELQKAIEDALTRYSFTPDNLNSFYSSLRDVAVQADKGIVKISSGKQQTGLFGNPVESTGDYAGAVIAKTPGEYLIFTCADAVRQADSISVTFSDGTKVTGQTKQIDEVLNMAVISVKCQELGEELRKEIKILTLGNSYSVKTGDIVIGVGGPSGQVHSMTYGTVSYIARNVQMTDGITRIIYADICSNSTMGTFLLNTAGEIIGWTSDDYKNEENRDITASVSISDYKPVIEKMTNGHQVPYFGVRGQEVNEAMAESGIPQGVYVVEAVSGGPAYDAGIQNGDIITLFGEKEITTFKELQMQIENARCGSRVTVKIMRKGPDGYKELDPFEVEIRAR